MLPHYYDLRELGAEYYRNYTRGSGLDARNSDTVAIPHWLAALWRASWRRQKEAFVQIFQGDSARLRAMATAETPGAPRC